MVRNAIDHGIEPPEEREAIGKEAEGLVEVRAAREGNDIVISVRDDGRGVDPDAVRSTAVARGIVAEAAAADLSLDGIYDLLFLPGFSTASTVTEISGRGVGLDVVRANVRSAGGDVSIRSEAGSFTIIEMRLPVRVSARDVLLVEAANEWYGIPLDTVRRTLSMPSAGLQTIAGTPAIVHDEQVVPLLSLAELLGQAHHRARPEWLDVVVLDSRSQTGALLVDAIGQRYQLTVKPLDPYLATPGVDGAAILADGRVVLVLDPEPLMNALEERSCNRSSPWSSSRS
jgi:two-component system chemotaxis sensor kinase CheA